MSVATCYISHHLIACYIFREEFRRAGIDEVFAKPLDIPRLEHYFLKVTGKLAEGDDV